MKKELFEVRDIDRKVYQEELASFLPDKMIDIHTHVWLKQYRKKEKQEQKRTVTWPSLVAEDNPLEDLQRTYELMFPGKQVLPLIFSSLTREDDWEAQNGYISQCTVKHGVPSLMYAFPEWSGEELFSRVTGGHHLGIKVYLNLSPAYLPRKEIRIFDFIPHHQLKVLNQHKMILMLHIPRDGRLGDPVNIAQMLEIEEKYPDLRVIYAHIGRAYCPEDFGDAFELLKHTKHLTFDFSATTQDEAMYRALDMVGPQRFLFGSDLPILRMRMRRICEDGRYINIVPKGMYGDVSGDPNMRETDGSDAESLTFFMYEELRAFRRAAERLGLSRDDVEAICCKNGRKLIADTAEGLYGASSKISLI